MKTINKYGPLKRKNITYQVGHEERDILVPLQAVTAAEGALPELLTGLPCTEVVRTANINGCMGNTYELRHRDGGNVCVNIPFVEDTAEDALVAVRIFRNVKECAQSTDCTATLFELMRRAVPDETGCLFRVHRFTLLIEVPYTTASLFVKKDERPMSVRCFGNGQHEVYLNTEDKAFHLVKVSEVRRKSPLSDAATEIKVTFDDPCSPAWEDALHTRLPRLYLIESPNQRETNTAILQIAEASSRSARKKLAAQSGTAFKRIKFSRKAIRAVVESAVQGI